MKITKLYQQDRYLKNWTARITSVRASDETPGQFTLTLDRTAFFPEGGGQSCDTGTIETPHGKFRKGPGSLLFISALAPLPLLISLSLLLPLQDLYQVWCNKS